MIQEPRGEVYERLITLARGNCDQFILVTRHSIGLEAPGVETLQRLNPELIARDERSEWPGTQIFDDMATVFLFRLNQRTTDVLQDVASSLFAWQQPRFPEDLCLLRADGEPWLVTISHERDAYFVLSSAEHLELSGAIPELRLELS